MCFKALSRKLNYFTVEITEHPISRKKGKVVLKILRKKAQ
jgi:hypothetical protein